MFNVVLLIWCGLSLDCQTFYRTNDEVLDLQLQSVSISVKTIKEDGCSFEQSTLGVGAG